MRYARLLLIGLLALVGLFLSPSGAGEALPPPLPLFSVRDLGSGFHDITTGVSGFGLTCTAADLLTDPAAGAAFPCAARVTPAPAGPVPDATTVATIDLGLDLLGPFFDDLDGISFSEHIAPGVRDFDFSVSAAPGEAPAPFGTTGPVVSCGILPDVTSEAAATEAQGDIFNTGTLAPFGCNTQVVDEGTLGLYGPLRSP